MPKSQWRQKWFGLTLGQWVLLPTTLGLFAGGAILLWTMTLPLPDFNSFDNRLVAQSTKIYDRTGKVLLYDVHGDVKRTIVPITSLSRHLKNATVAIEDAEFYEHRGVKPTAIIRAFLVNLLSGSVKQGGSTITQQVVKNVLLTQEKKLSRKIKEVVLALKLERVKSKDAILELYLNEAPYGGNLYGAEEAAQAYFQKSAKDLSLAEAAYLAAVPKAPTYYSPYGNHRQELENRKNLVLRRMREVGFISAAEEVAARTEKVAFAPREEKGLKAPHFVFYVIDQLENRYGRDAVETGGLRVLTTLDWEWQKSAEEIVARNAADNEKNFNARNAALVAVDPLTGQILTLVGSRDYFDVAHEGNFNVALAHRQPGSAFKPFVYATAFAKGYAPETVVFDLPTQFDVKCDATGKPRFPGVEPADCYAPINYDNRFRGPVTLREALAQSINIPAIKTLYLAGLVDSLNTARNLGITSLTDPNRYGLTLVLGGGEVSLLELTSAYGVFATEGVRRPPVAILEVRDKRGERLEQFTDRPETVLPENAARQISSILSDNQARSPAFGERSYLYFDGRDVAAKTGTTNDYRDAWILGYTPQIAVGAWAGNNDNTPMEKKVAGFIIAPLWHEFMATILAKLPPVSFTPPEPTPADLRPILRGQWRGDETTTTDSADQIHSILYWVDRTNPLGPPPSQPENDPQFSLWEPPVRQWAAEQGRLGGNTAGAPQTASSSTNQ